MLGFKEYLKQIDETLVIVNKGKKQGQAVVVVGGAGCFDGDTMIETETGEKCISNINVGDRVYTLNEITGERELQSVLDTIEYTTTDVIDRMMELTFEDGSIVKCTENHEFFVDGKWVKAVDL